MNKEHPCPRCKETLGFAEQTEIRYQNIKNDLQKLRDFIDDLNSKLTEVREELSDQGNDFRIVPLAHQDSGVVLAVCESIGVDLIPLFAWQGSVFLGEEMLKQLNEAMEEFKGKEAS